MEQSLWQKSHEVDQVHKPHKRIQAILSEWEINLRTANLVCFKILLLQVICKTPSKHQEVFCVFSDPARFFCLDVQEAISSVPQQCRIGNPVAGCRFYL